MEQHEIFYRTTAIIHSYTKRAGISYFNATCPIRRILQTRGITPDLPMYATARLLVTRDILRVWEGVD